jgi:hypothetical protein
VGALRDSCTTTSRLALLTAVHKAAVLPLRAISLSLGVQLGGSSGTGRGLLMPAAPLMPLHYTATWCSVTASPPARLAD